MVHKESFKGECEELHGKVYYIGSAKQADNYNTTTEAIMEYFLRKYTHGLDLVQTLEALKMKDFGFLKCLCCQFHLGHQRNRKQHSLMCTKRKQSIL